MSCPKCGYVPLKPQGLIALLCQLCGKEFHTRAVVAVCPPCSQTAHIEVAGEVSGC